eukprot:TRINITY_DN882_c0_g1_i2.p1 TRINITY_DN882_c0_g1~~TRINITY_DN882_c0_g1_i2.p1  ORF type:complete len:388 (-),score=98.14 TRINITY_DN882_c0_g1_i2:172-1335(-)
MDVELELVSPRKKNISKSKSMGSIKMRLAGAQNGQLPKFQDNMKVVNGEKLFLFKEKKKPVIVAVGSQAIRFLDFETRDELRVFGYKQISVFGSDTATSTFAFLFQPTISHPGERNVLRADFNQCSELESEMLKQIKLLLSQKSSAQNVDQVMAKSTHSIETSSKFSFSGLKLNKKRKSIGSSSSNSKLTLHKSVKNKENKQPSQPDNANHVVAAGYVDDDEKLDQLDEDYENINPHQISAHDDIDSGVHNSKNDEKKSTSSSSTTPTTTTTTSIVSTVKSSRRQSKSKKKDKLNNKESTSTASTTSTTSSTSKTTSISTGASPSSISSSRKINEKSSSISDYHTKEDDNLVHVDVDADVDDDHTLVNISTNETTTTPTSSPSKKNT